MICPSQVSPSKDFFKQIDNMLQTALQFTSEHITDCLSREIRELGQRTADLETCTDNMELSYREHVEAIESLQEEKKMLLCHLEDSNNRLCCSNLRVWGMPEMITGLQSTTTALFQELMPLLPIERLEMDRVHRALSRQQPDGPPRDVIIKFQFYRTKDQLLSAAHNKESLNFQGHNYQIFL